MITFNTDIDMVKRLNRKRKRNNLMKNLKQILEDEIEVYIRLPLKQFEFKSNARKI